MRKISKSFEAWAKSFSGCDGGNLNGSIWFSGIEYGGSKLSDFIPLEDPIDMSDEDVRKNYFNYQYDRKVMKLYSSIIGRSAGDYREVFHFTNAFKNDSDVFKMNIYPLAFKNDWKGNWTKELYEKTGFISKTHYQSWCQLERFPIIKNWVRNYQPKIIIATGLTYSLEYRMAFCGIEAAFKEPSSKDVQGKKIFWIEVPDCETILFIIPFLGPGGLMRDDHIHDFGLRIADISENYHGGLWHRQYN